MAVDDLSGEPETMNLPLLLRIPLAVVVAVAGLVAAFVMDVVQALRHRDEEE